MAQITLNVTKDASIKSDTVSTNYNDTVLRVGSDFYTGFWRTLLHFDLSSLAGKNVLSAILRMCQGAFPDTPATLPFSVYCITADWGENTVTWANQPSFSETAKVDLSINTTSQAWREFNITALIQDIVNNSRTYYGLLLRQPGTESNALKYFFSSEQAGYEPQLIVDCTGELKARVAGVWKETEQYVRVAGVWRPASAFGRAGGVWRQGI